MPRDKSANKRGGKHKKNMSIRKFAPPPPPPPPEPQERCSPGRDESVGEHGSLEEAPVRGTTHVGGGAQPNNALSKTYSDLSFHFAHHRWWLGRHLY